MRFNIVTLFPDFFQSPLQQSILKKAIEKKVISVNIYNLRDFSKDKHKKCDDYPYGGGSGMILSPAPLFRALETIKKQNTQAYVIYFSPQGEILNHKLISTLLSKSTFILICGHYEGIDQRVIDKFVDKQISIGDFILTGGEIPCLAFIDAVTRQLPSVLGNPDSLKTESFTDGLLEYSQYTRPAVYDGLRVPKVLLSGNHKKIERWRYLSRVKNTFLNRPELLNNLSLSADIKAYIRRLQKRKKNE